MDYSNKTSQLSNYISKLLRDHFGKGPESVHVSIGTKYITIYVKNFMSPTEKILLQQQHEKIVNETRDLVMDTVIPEIKANIHFITGMEIKEFYYDWSLHNRSAVMVGISTEESKCSLPIEESFTGQEGMHSEIVNITKTVQKVPEKLYSFRLNQRTYIFIRYGLLVSIEKQLIRQGLHEELRIAKRELEKGYLHKNSHFEEIMQTKINEIFVDWDFDLDKSVIVIITEPSSHKDKFKTHQPPS